MSQQKDRGQTKYANTNLNAVFTKPSQNPTNVGGTINRFSGMLVLPKVHINSL